MRVNNSIMRRIILLSFSSSCERGERERERDSRAEWGREIISNSLCLLSLAGIPERIDYAPGSSRQELFPEASLELCDVPCAINTVETKLQLSTIHIGKGCDRDTYGVHSQRKLCGKK